MTEKISDHQTGLLGIIGGTGLYHIEGLKITNQIEVLTPFGAPSAPLTIGKLGDQEVVFLPRHGLNHQIMPSEVNFRANIYALKNVGVTRIISISAVGSLQSELPMGDFAIPSQYFDWTKGLRNHTFFGEGMVAHVSTAEPACAHLMDIIKSAGEKNGIHIHTGVSYACVEGPRLGTRAESNYLKNVVGCDVVGMSNIPEAFLAKEAQLCYATIAIITDYDCWLDDPAQHVSVAQVFKTYDKSIQKVKDLLEQLLQTPLPEPECECRTSLQYAMLTPEEVLTEEKMRIFKVLKK